MKITVMGAGAVGCFYGAMLAKAGHDVTFVGRPAHVTAINANGLLLEMGGRKEAIRARASTDASGARGADLVLVSVKSADTEAAGRELLAHLTANCALISLQNGVDNADRLSAVVGRPVIAAAVYVGTEMGGPGHVVHKGRGELMIGASAASEGLAALLTSAGIPTTIAADIAEPLWAKLIVNCCYNAISALAQMPYGAMLAVPGTREVMTNVVDECVAVARACGVAQPADVLQRTLRIAELMPTQYSSTAQDLARSKPTEIDYLNGHVVRKGAEHGIATPTNLALTVLVKLAEKGRST